MVVSKGISRKRKLALVLFLIIVTLVVLYSYCYGKSICYTMPLFTDWNRVTVTENKHGYVLTSSVHLKAETSDKPGSYKENTNEKSQPTHGKGNATIDSTSSVDNSLDGESGEDDVSSFSGLSGSGHPVAMSGVGMESLPTLRPIRPPSDITGEVAEEILRAANITINESERGLVRVKRPLAKPIGIKGKISSGRILKRDRGSNKKAGTKLTHSERIGKIKQIGSKNKMKSWLRKANISKGDEKGELLPKNWTEFSGSGISRKAARFVRVPPSAYDKELLRVKRLGNNDNEGDDDNDDEDDGAADDDSKYVDTKSGIRKSNLTNTDSSQALQHSFGYSNYKQTKESNKVPITSVNNTTIKKLVRKNEQYRLETAKGRGNVTFFPVLGNNKTTALTVYKKIEFGANHKLKGSLQKTVDIYNNHNVSQTRENKKQEIGVASEVSSSSKPTHSMHPLGQLLSHLGKLKEHIRSIKDNSNIESNRKRISVRIPTRASTNSTFSHTREKGIIVTQPIPHATSVSNITTSSSGLGKELKSLHLSGNGSTRSQTKSNFANANIYSMPAKFRYKTGRYSNTRPTFSSVLNLRQTGETSSSSNSSNGQNENWNSSRAEFESIPRKNIFKTKQLSNKQKISPSALIVNLNTTTNYSRYGLNASAGQLQSISPKDSHKTKSHSNVQTVSSPAKGQRLQSSIISKYSRVENERLLKNHTNSLGNTQLSNTKLNRTIKKSFEPSDETMNSKTAGSSESGSGSGLMANVSGSDVGSGAQTDGKNQMKQSFVRPTIATPLTPPRRQNAGNKKKTPTQFLANGLIKYNVLSCEPLDPTFLLFNRIFKTGSSTTEYFIKKTSRPLKYSYHLGTTEDWYDISKPRLYPGLILRKASQKRTKTTPRMAFVAHFYFRKRLKLKRAHTYINQIRDPIRRVISHYYYMRSVKRPKKRIKKFLKSKEFNETLEECFKKQHKGCESNVMTRFFCGTHGYCRTGSEKALQRAIYNIKHYYGVVGLLEQYDEYLHVLHKRFPRFFTWIESPSNARIKSNPSYDMKNISNKVKQMLKVANWADVKLYEFVRERFMKQAKSCGIVR